MKYLISLKTEELQSTWKIWYVSCEGHTRWYDKEVPASWEEWQVRESIQIGGCGDDIAEIVSLECLNEFSRAEKIEKMIELADNSKDEFMEAVSKYVNPEDICLSKGMIFRIVSVNVTPEVMNKIKDEPIVSSCEEAWTAEVIN